MVQLTVEHQLNMLQKLVVIVLCYFGIYSAVSATCMKDGDYNDMVTCSDFEALTKAGSHPEWVSLAFRNYRNKTQTTMKNDALTNVPNLKALIINDIVNKFEEHAFRGLRFNTTIQLESNDIEELPENIFKGITLKSLTITNSKLKKIPDNFFADMKFLEELNLENNTITSIGHCAFCNLNNTVIRLNNNSLEDFNFVDILGNSSDVKEIHLNSNKLNSMHKLGAMPNLRVLTVSNNSIENIDENSLVQCPNLVHLDVSCNKITKLAANVLPNTIRSDEKFSLDVSNNSMHCIPEDLRNKITVLDNFTINDNPWKCECLEQMKQWAKKLEANIGCKDGNDCSVSCVDSQNATKDISFESSEEDPDE